MEDEPAPSVAPLATTDGSAVDVTDELGAAAASISSPSLAIVTDIVNDDDHESTEQSSRAQNQTEPPEADVVMHDKQAYIAPPSEAPPMQLEASAFAPTMVSARVRTAFDAVDQQRTGSLESHELRTALHHAGLSIDSDSAARVIEEQYDGHHLNLDEFSMLVSDIESMITEVPALAVPTVLEEAPAPAEPTAPTPTTPAPTAPAPTAPAAPAPAALDPAAPAPTAPASTAPASTAPAPAAPTVPAATPMASNKKPMSNEKPMAMRNGPKPTTFEPSWGDPRPRQVGQTGPLDQYYRRRYGEVDGGAQLSSSISPAMRSVPPPTVRAPSSSSSAPTAPRRPHEPIAFNSSPSSRPASRRARRPSSEAHDTIDERTGVSTDSTFLWSASTSRSPSGSPRNEQLPAPPRAVCGFAHFAPLEAGPVMEVCSKSHVILREACDKSSAKLLDLRLGTRLMVLETRQAGDGCVRAAVMIEHLPDRPPHGWLTSRLSDGTSTIRECTRQALGPRADGVVMQPIAALRLEQLLLADQTGDTKLLGGKSKSPKTPKSPKPKASGAPGTNGEKKASSWKLVRSAVASVTAMAPAAAPAASPKKKEKKESSGRSKRGSSVQPLTSGRTLEASAIAYRARATEAEKAINEIYKPLDVQIGEALLVAVKQNVKIDELVASWAKRKGEVFKMEFRKNIRHLVDKPDTKIVDKIFEGLDTNKDGKLDVQEIRSAFKKLLKNAQATAAENEKKAARIAKWISIAEHAEDAARATIANEEAGARLEELTAYKSVGARLGEMLYKRNVKVLEVVTQWDPTGNDNIERHMFRQEVLKLGVEATREELDGLFDELDEDGGGTLDVEEVKHALKGLHQTATEEQREKERLKSSTLDFAKSTRAAQEEWRRLKKEDEAFDAALAEEAVRLEEARVAALASKAQQDLEAREAKQAALAAAKEEYERKIAIRREAQGFA